MEKHFISVALTLAVVALSVASCEKTPYPGYRKSDNGLYYKFLTENAENADRVAQEGDVVFMDFAYYLDDSLLFERHHDGFNDRVRPSVFKGDLYEGLSMMHEGDSLSMIMRADSVFYKLFGVQQLPAYVKPESAVRFEVKMNEILSREEYEARENAKKEALDQEADGTLAQYLQENGITAQPTESGLIYVCTKTKKGLKPQAGQRVKVHYTGKLLDGTVFDSSVERGEPFEFALGAGQVIKGWDEGIALMSKGEKGILYIPYDLAYGQMGAGGVIPPYANLIFEVELIDFE